ncbi:MAG: YgiQ family radical SAM protein [Candidatus Cloacimonadota bacterium]|nr:MAG: YgiQ family radical SAM protein [Candidatus Cloacimonadota bacterium]
MIKQPDFIPTTLEEVKKLDWYPLDVIIITGDCYVDHPGFGSAVIGRFLINAGFRTGIIDQPDCNNLNSFRTLGCPKLFFGITSGNMDSMVNHYTAQKKIRSEDAYSPDGKTGLRPDRALSVYSQKVRQAFKKVKIVLGGIEAGMRRIPHYDFWSDKIRNSVLYDTKADVLVYGMGEKPIVQIAELLKKNKEPENIRGTVILSKKIPENGVELPSVKKVKDKQLFYEMSKTFDKFFREKPLFINDNGRILIHYPPQKHLSTAEMDAVYNMPFRREKPPKYKNKTITAFEQIKLSVSSHRGCFGGCSFCTIGYHQGKSIQSRSKESIIKEINELKKKKYFKGTVSDLGGPSANMYGMSCKINFSDECKRPSCLVPDICPNLDTDHHYVLDLLNSVKKIKGVKNLFIASGIRFDLSNSSDKYIQAVADNYIGGHLKLAPEHKSDKVLKLMNKPSFSVYEDFCRKFISCSGKSGKNQKIIPYVIAGHPGAELSDTIDLALFLKKKKIKLRQIQEFTPTPMTISSCMYYTEKDFFSGKKIHVAKGREIRLMKALIQWWNPDNKKLVIEALRKAKKTNLIKQFYK